MQTQYEVKFLKSVFSLKVELFSSSLGYDSIYSIQMEYRGLVESFPVDGRSRIMDPMTWYGNLT
jgi:hypothetical protein